MRESPAAGNGGPTKKKPRVSTHVHRSQSSTAAVIIDSSFPGKTLNNEPTPPPASSVSSGSSPPIISGGFNDSSTADVILRLFLEPSPFHSSSSSSSSPPPPLDSDVFVFLHSSTLRRAKYFAAALSDRWQTKKTQTQIKPTQINLGVSSNISTYLTVLRLIYTMEFSDTITTPSVALSILPVALELLFEDCVKYCVKFLEAVPWTEDEEKTILALVPLLGDEESKELLARVSPVRADAMEQMLHGLLVSATHYYHNTAYVKAFVSKLLKDSSSSTELLRDLVRRALEKAFEDSLTVVKEALEEYSSPVFGGNHNEMEAVQRLNLHTAMTNMRHLLWLVERMIELKVADGAVKAWSELAAFTADLHKAIREDAWRNIVPGFPNVVLRCTCKLTNAVAAGTILASKQVRKKLVKDWLPVLIVCKENMSSMMPNHKSLYLELEETFLKIISTLPMSDAQDLLKQCLNFTTRNVEDCPHLFSAFNTWLRRATQQPGNIG